jgi:hypothetical protein
VGVVASAIWVGGRVVGLRGFLPLSGPEGHQLALDHNGRLVCVQDGKLLTGVVDVCRNLPCDVG